MDKIVSDQADGLRRLLARSPTRIVAFAGMLRGMGVTAAVMNLAAALAQQGRQVLVLDEHHFAPESISQLWGVQPFGSLSDVMSQGMSCEEAVATAPCGVRVLPALEFFGAFDPQRLQPNQVVLIDAHLDYAGNLSPLARLAGELVVVLRPDPSAITATYAGIKRLHYAHALKQLRFLLNGIGDEDSAQRIAHNMAEAGSRYLGVSLESAGWLHRDGGLVAARSRQLTVVEAFPASPSAQDARRIADDMGQWPWRPAVAHKPAAGHPRAGEAQRGASAMA